MYSIEMDSNAVVHNNSANHCIVISRCSVIKQDIVIIRCSTSQLGGVTSSTSHSFQSSCAGPSGPPSVGTYRQ